ncbi:hypothetical protein PA7559_35530 [Pseudoalteromonas distincta]
MGAILNANSVLHYSSAFLAGIGIKLLLDKFYISHSKRSTGFNWRYPPVTIAVLASLLITAFYMLNTAPKLDEAALYAQSFMSLKYLALTFIGMLITVIYQAKLYTQKPIFTAVLVALSTMYVGFAVGLAYIAAAFYVFISLAASYLILAIYLLCDEHRQSKQQNFTSEIEPIETKESPELKTLEDFREWFKDDSTIKSKEKLEPDLQVYAKRITERLQNGGDKDEKDLAQHIALCGPYGCGKSSIVESIVNGLAKKPEKESIWIHSDISTWGAASGSVAHVVLSHIIDDISQYVDMCAFRALPKHYTEALKSGGSVFQFASTLLAGPVDIEGSFQKLNDVLDTTNHKLLITLQDVDRGTGDENEKRLNDIAALLDKLKGKSLSHINFIVAMGNENEVAAEVISKATDYREDVLSFDARRILSNFVISSLEFAISYHQVYATIIKDCKRFYILEDGKFIDTIDIAKWRIKELIKSPFYNSVELVDKKITSLRELKKILRRVSQIWQPTGLMGEVHFTSLLMSIVLKEVSPHKFEQILQNKSYPSDYQGFDLTEFIEGISGYDNTNKDNFMFEYYKAMLGLKYKATPEKYAGQVRMSLVQIKEEDRELTFNNTCNYFQYFGRNYGDVCYLDRVALEALPNNSCSDQETIRDIRSLFEVKKSDFSELLPLVTKILSYSTTQEYNFERFMSVGGIFSVEDLNRFKNTIGSALSRGDKSEYLVSNNLDQTLINIIAPNITIECLYPLFEQLSMKNEWAMQFDRQLKNITFLCHLMRYMGLKVDNSLDTVLISVLRSTFSRSDLVAATFLFALLKSFLRGKDKKDIKNGIGSFQLSGIKLTSLLGVNKIEDVIDFISNFKEADFRCIPNAPNLNQEIKKLLHKNHTFYQLVDKFLLSAK